MASGHDAQVAGERIEALLAKLRSDARPQVAEAAEELVGCLVELYGAGLAQIVQILRADAGADGSGPRLLERLVADPLVESLLLVHDLHPLDVGARVQRVIDEVLPQFGSHAGTAEYQGIDDQGVIHLRLEEAGGHGCGSSTGAVQAALEESIAAAAPEAAGLSIEVVELPAELPLLQIGRRPAGLQGTR
ncbi:MAG: NifU family protein [Actinomycetota bacterium]|nr:NifU family protein [Actinomycetota bacterium]